jgi:hypothetical protein
VKTEAVANEGGSPPKTLTKLNQIKPKNENDHALNPTGNL